MKQDSIEVEILPNGDIKITTDPISPPNHASAEKLLLAIGEAGKTHRKRKTGASHHHSHSHGKEEHSH